MNVATGQPWIVNDSSNNFSGNLDNTDRWNFYGNPSDFKSGSESLPYCSGFGSPGSVTCASQSGVFPNLVTPFPSSYGSSNTSLLGSDPSTSGKFGCGCGTPDVINGNPILGSGSARVMQLGFKFTF